jgi:uncharacterized protein YjcR
MNKDEKKQLAQTYYLTTQLSQKEIAAIAKVSENTVSKWAKDGKWKELKAAKTITRAHLLSGCYIRLDNLNKEIDKAGGIPTKTMSDAVATIIKQIEILDKGDSLSLYVGVMEAFVNHMVQANPALAKQIIPYQLEFLESRVKQH